MAGPVMSAEDATEVARSFLKKDYVSTQPLKAALEEGNWIVEIDVGLLLPKVIKLTIEPATGQIKEYAVVREGK